MECRICGRENQPETFIPNVCEHCYTKRLTDAVELITKLVRSADFHRCNSENYYGEEFEFMLSAIKELEGIKKRAEIKRDAHQKLYEVANDAELEEIKKRAELMRAKHQTSYDETRAYGEINKSIEATALVRAHCFQEMFILQDIDYIIKGDKSESNPTK